MRPIISASPKTPSLIRKRQVRGLRSQKKRSLNLVNEYFSDEYNKEIGVFLQRLIKIVIIITLFTSTSCDKKNKYPLADISVREYININSAEYISLRVPGGSATIEGGLNGIVVYRISENSFGVFERACPNEPDEDCAVNAEGATAKCPCCGSRYSLIDGNLIDGPSRWPLKPYYSSFDGSFLLVSN